MLLSRSLSEALNSNMSGEVIVINPEGVATRGGGCSVSATGRGTSTSSGSSSNSNSNSNTWHHDVSPQKVHIKLKLNGTPEQIATFHSLMKFRDMDWPYTRHAKRMTGDLQPCPKCKGMVYNRPTMAPADIKAAAKQAGLRKIRIQHFAKPCMLTAKEAAALMAVAASAMEDTEGYN